MVVVLLASTKAAAANLVATAVLPGSIRAPLDRQDVDAVGLAIIPRQGGGIAMLAPQASPKAAPVSQVAPLVVPVTFRQVGQPARRAPLVQPGSIRGQPGRTIAAAVRLAITRILLRKLVVKHAPLDKRRALQAQQVVAVAVQVLAFELLSFIPLPAQCVLVFVDHAYVFVYKLICRSIAPLVQMISVCCVRYL